MDRGADDACGFGTEGLQAGTEGNGQKDSPCCAGPAECSWPCILRAWFESLNQTSVASPTAIVCTEEVIWVALGYCLFMKGKISVPAGVSILVTVGGSLLIAFSDYSAGETICTGDVLAPPRLYSAPYTPSLGVRPGVICPTTIYTYIVYVFCALALGLATAFSGLAFTGYGVRSVVVGLLLSVCSTLLGHSIFSWCLKFFPLPLCICLQAVRACGCCCLALFLFRKCPRPADSGRCGDNQGRSPLFSGGRKK